MPRIKSAKKALRASERKRAHNVKIKENFKALVKKIKKGEKKDLSKVSSLLDKAAAKNVIHKKKAARLKSRLSKVRGTQVKEIRTAKRKKIKKKSLQKKVKR